MTPQCVPLIGQAACQFEMTWLSERFLLKVVFATASDIVAASGIEMTRAEADFSLSPPPPT